ncbi:MAG: very short patch repair endonuclease [Candidatus Moranbacteria bacterium]|nr:very short patch repair endonuclease [Candidatus Moranbacteria bacterium]
MADIFTKEKRSEIMSRIRGKNTKVEVMFRKALSAEVYPKGYSYRIHYKKIVGSPDVVFVKQKIAIFIDGDFWHGRGYGKNGKRLKKKFWRDKIEKNRLRDRKVNRQLRREGWSVLRYWESDVKKNIGKIIGRVLESL